MLKAFAGKGDFPKIRTFNKSDISTNSVYKDLEAAEKMYVIFPSPRFYNNSIVTVSKRRNLVLICYGGKRYIENDFKIITKKILKCKSIYIPYEGYLINRYCILHEKLFLTLYTENVSSKDPLLLYVVIICYGVVLIWVWMVWRLVTFSCALIPACLSYSPL